MTDEQKKKVESVVKNFGQSLGGSAVGGAVLMSVLGVGAGLLAKCFQIIEFTGMLKLLNCKFGELSEFVMSIARSLADLDLIDFVTEASMKSQLSNTVAGPWKGKLSAEGVAPWILQDIGYVGILMLCLYII